MTDMKRVRCAIYTRKSSEEGLDQTFNSLHAQREACEAYVLSQKHEGWEVISTQYDDGGFSGGNMERPGLKKLLADIAAKRVDTIVVYKVDRLTRSLTDFARIVEQFDGQGVSFVSVTQQFNTTSSMGRLTLNVLLSFAQFEREVTGERIRDKIAASKRKGMWMGGVIPLGYDLLDHALILNVSEAERVRTIYRLYLELGCVSKLQEHLHAAGIRSKKRLSKTGHATGDATFSRGSLYELLQNPLYLGKVRHKGELYPGMHQAIIDLDIWARVQAQLAKNAPPKGIRSSNNEPHMLTGRIFDAEGHGFTPSHTTKKGRRYRYYELRQTGPSRDGCRASVLRLPAREIEGVVIGRLAELMRSPQDLAEMLSVSSSDADEMKIIVNAVASRSSSLGDHDALIKFAKRITVDRQKVTIALCSSNLRTALGLTMPEGTAGSPEIACDASLKRVGPEMRFALAGQVMLTPRDQHSLTRGIVNARDWLDRIFRGEALNQRDLAKQTGLDERYISRILPLAFLAPDITEEILAGGRSLTCSLDSLVQSVVLQWPEQRQILF